MDHEHENEHKHEHDHHNMHEGHEHHEQMNHSDSGDAHASNEKKHDHADHTGHEIMFRDRFWVSLLLSIPVLLYSPVVQRWLSFQTPQFAGSAWIVPVISVIIFAFGGLPFIRMAIPEIRTRKPGMMTLITLAISVSFIYSMAALVLELGEGFFWELVTLIDVMLLGHWIEMRSVRQASGALNELAKLMPDEAEKIKSDGSIELVPVNTLARGDIVLVRPGANIPVDGVVFEGSSKVNEAMITGESKPVEKLVGSKVIAGANNEDGSLRITVNATGDQTALAGIMRLVSQAQSSKSNTQILADKAAGWLFYLAVGAALLTALLWSIATGFNLFALQRVVTVLVIACPHALGLAVPLVVSISTASAAKNGVLIMDRLALESARQIDMVVFDKTGTLTTGNQGVVNILTTGEWKDDSALALAAAIEQDSEHNIAKALRKAAAEKKLTLPRIKKFRAIRGHGVSAEYEGKEVFLGGPKMLARLAIELPSEFAEFSTSAGNRAETVIFLAISNRIVAAFSLADVLRPESKTVIKRLEDMGIQVAMLTGDSQEVAQSVSAQLGIDKFYAEVLPEEKDKKISDLQSQGYKVAMVGDGINDAPALARADVGISIGSGTDVAAESAGIILVNDNPMDVLKIFAISKASYEKMIQNLIWATGYNIVAIPLAAGVLAAYGIWLSPAVGALFMSASTVIVAINANLMKRQDFSIVKIESV
jgi:Cu2+-exporting ATPase